jgi:hypothetical protein
MPYACEVTHHFIVLALLVIALSILVSYMLKGLLPTALRPLPIEYREG